MVISRPFKNINPHSVSSQWVNVCSPKIGQVEECDGIGFFCFVALNCFYSCLKTYELSVYHSEADQFHHVHGGKTKTDNHEEKSFSLFFNRIQHPVNAMIQSIAKMAGMG